MAEFDLHGTVGSIAVLRRRFGAPRNQRDALLIAIRECKLSVVEFDPATLSIVSSSLHSWETPTGSCGVPSALRVGVALPPLAVSDPEGRCAAVLLPSEENLASPFSPRWRANPSATEEDEEDEEDDDDPDAPGASRTQSEIRARKATAASVRESYVVDLTERLGLRRARRRVFARVRRAARILILHERAPTWAARVSLAADTCAVSAVSLDLDKRRHTVIWSREQLPHTCYRLCAVPDPLGGALVLSQNFISHESQESPRALALNPLAAGDAGDPAGARRPRRRRERPRRPPPRETSARRTRAWRAPSALSRREGTESALGVSVELDSAHAAVLSERQVLLTTKAGALMLLNPRVEGRRCARTGAMTLRRAGGAVLSSGMCLVTRSLVFSDLARRRFAPPRVAAEKEAATETGMLPEAKRRKGGCRRGRPPAARARDLGVGRARVEGGRRRRARGDAVRRRRGRRRGEGCGTRRRRRIRRRLRGGHRRRRSRRRRASRGGGGATRGVARSRGSRGTRSPFAIPCWASRPSSISLSARPRPWRATSRNARVSRRRAATGRTARSPSFSAGFSPNSSPRLSPDPPRFARHVDGAPRVAR